MTTLRATKKVLCKPYGTQWRKCKCKFSLKKPSTTTVEHFVINAHWTKSNINHIIDYNLERSPAVVISKDAKAIIPANIQPVLLNCTELDSYLKKEFIFIVDNGPAEQPSSAMVKNVFDQIAKVT